MRDGMECPDANELQELMSGQLAAAQRAKVTAHLDGCGECREVVASLARGTAASAIAAIAHDATLAPAAALGIARTVDSGSAEEATRSEQLAAGAQIGRYVITARLGAWSSDDANATTPQREQRP